MLNTESNKLLSFPRCLYMLSILCCDGNNSYANIERLKLLCRLYDLNDDRHISDGYLREWIMFIYLEKLNYIESNWWIEQYHNLML